MGIGKVLIIGGLIGGAGYLLLKNSSAASAPPGRSVPPGWSPPGTAVVVELAPAATPVGVPLALASWPADPGQPQGNFLLIWNTAAPTTFVALFYPKDSSGAVSKVPAVMQMGTDAGSKQILDQLAQISAGVQQKNLAA